MITSSDAATVLGDSRLVLGGSFGVEPFERSDRRLRAFSEAGGTFIETAHSYVGGKGIAAVGRWLRGNPGRLDVVVKVGHDGRGQDMPLTRENVVRDLTDDLATLGTDTVGVVMLHCDDPDRPVDELADTLGWLVESGYARSVGVSNWSPGRLGLLAVTLRRRGHRPLASYHYSLALPPGALRGSSLAADHATTAVLDDADLPLLSWSANAGGYFATGQPDLFDSPTSRTRRARCAELAGRLGLTPATVALAWVLARQHNYASVGGSAEHLEQAFAATKVRLSPDDAAWLAGQVQDNEVRHA